MQLGIEGFAAPELTGVDWLGGHDGSFSHLHKYKLLLFFQSWCKGCHERGLPVIARLHSLLEDKIHICAVQTVFEGFQENTAQAALATREQYALTVPFGHDDGNKRGSLLLAKYCAGGTPWFVLIDAKNTVVFNGFGVEESALVQFLLERI